MSGGFRFHLRSCAIALTIVFATLIAIPIAIFFFSQLVEAYRFPMWEDEMFSLYESIRPHSYLDILLRGAQGQGSPSPLDYLLNKPFDQLKATVQHFSLPPHVYFRLFSNLITTTTAFVVTFWFAIDCIKSRSRYFLITIAQLMILACVPIAFLYEFQIYKYAHEMRPYALWVSVYFISLSAILKWNGSVDRRLIFVLVMLSLSATASLFQIACMIAAFVFVKWVNKIDSREILKSGTKLFLIPMLIALYYCLRTSKWGYYGPGWGTWSNFYEYWEHFAILIPMMIGAAIWCLRTTESKHSAVAPISFLLMYLLGPFLYWLTRSRGFFYTDRQYLYYELARPLFLLTAVQCLSSLEGIKSKRWLASVLIVVLVFCGSIGLRSKFLKRFQKSINQTGELQKGIIF